MKVRLPSGGGVTLIENRFIDRYMSSANGEYVKLYLYLLRCASSGMELSISGIADFFDHTEKDVRRALAYWEKMRLLNLRYDDNGTLHEIRFLSGADADSEHAADSAAAGDRQPGGGTFTADPEAESWPDTTGAGRADGLSARIEAQPSAGTFRQPDALSDSFSLQPEEAGAGVASQRSAAGPAQAPAISSGKITEFPAITRDVREAMARREDVQQIYFIAENYYGRPLSRREQDDLLYFLCNLNFSADLVEYLLEYCISGGHTSMHYIGKVAMAWYEKGITTVQQAREETSVRNTSYYDIFRALGIRRNPAPAEARIMDRWLYEYGFDLPVICEACSRTVVQAGSPSLAYAESILRSWHEQGIRDMNGIQAEDQVHAASVAAAAAARGSASGSGTGSRTAARTARGAQNTGAGRSTQNAGTGRFNNFQQRSYDWDSIEQQLLEAQTGKEG